MEFDLKKALPVLARTPAVIRTMLADLPDGWVERNEGPQTWSPYDVVGHLIHGERTDWMPRIDHLLAHGDAVSFPPFDRFAQLEDSARQSLDQLLDSFSALRSASLERLVSLQFTAIDFERTGRHPEFGTVTLGQLLATWVAHDLDHIVQIARCMGRQYSDAVGPWRNYLRIIGPE